MHCAVPFGFLFFVAIGLLNIFRLTSRCEDEYSPPHEEMAAKNVFLL